MSAVCLHFLDVVTCLSCGHGAVFSMQTRIPSGFKVLLQYRITILLDMETGEEMPYQIFYVYFIPCLTCFAQTKSQ